MKKFDLDAAKRGEPIQTRDGKPVKFIAHVPEAQEPLRVIVLIGDIPEVRYERGAVYDFRGNDSDLFMAPRKRTVWVNLYQGECSLSSSVYETQQKADSGSKVIAKQRIGNRAWPLEIEE